MLYLKEISYENIDKEYEAIKSIPAEENGFINKYHDVTREEFVRDVIPKLKRISKGLDLQEGYVPDTYFFLWDDDEIVGLFKIRHYLNDTLKEHAGHMGGGIVPGKRGIGYGKRGLAIALKKCAEIIKEDEIYLCVHKDNVPSLRMVLENHGFITKVKDKEFLLRVKPEIDDVTFNYRDLKRDDWKRLLEKKVVIDDISTKYFDGKVSIIEMVNVTSPLSVESPFSKVKIADNGYKNLIIAPKNQNWWLTVMYDDKDNIIESYFDITRVNCFDAETPYFIDMKLDVCIQNHGDAKIMDDADLKEVLDKGMITKEDYDNAYLTANKIIDFYNNNRNLYYEFIDKTYQKMKSKLV